MSDQSLEELQAENAALKQALEQATTGNGSPAWATHMLLQWCADRMVRVYGESENVDFVKTIRETSAKVMESYMTWREITREKKS